MSSDKLQVTTGAEFAKASAKLPKEIRAKLSKATFSLFNDVGSLGAHLEKIQSADDDIYSLRVDDCYRIILKYPNKGNVALLLYVDRHDDAYEWAKRHITSINTVTGGIQTSIALTPNVIRTNGHPKPNAKLAALTDANMATLGIPPIYWNQLRTQVFTPIHLIGYKKILSYEVYSTLEEMLNGLPVNEAMQLYTELTQTIEPPKLTSIELNGLFDHVSDDELLLIGIPQQYLKLIRTIKLQQQLVNLSSILPDDAIQSLYALHNGESVQSISKLTYSDSKSVAEDDYKAALQNPISKAQFVTIEDEEAMHAFLEYPAAQWRAYLHPSQRRMIDRHYGGPARIIGGAGTGKTVVIVHRAKYLSTFCEANEKVLVTSYNKSLVADIEERLSTICTTNELSKIDVVTVDKKTYEITRKIGYSLKYGRQLEPIWSDAIAKSGVDTKFTLDFIRDEWTDVIQAQQILTKDQYIHALRTGRSKRLDQASREQLWKIFEAYKQHCQNSHIVDSDWAQNMCAEECKAHPDQYKYRSVLVDECQDLRAPAYRLLRALAGPQRQDDIFFSGDSRQRIYRGKASLSQCGIIINNRSTTLKLNYRTTAQIYESAMRIQKEYQYDDLDGKTVEHDLCTCIFHGEKPVIKSFLSDMSEWNAMVQDIKDKIHSGIPTQEICILTKNNTLVANCARWLNQEGIDTLQLSNTQNDDLEKQGVRIATMYRVKGMEYSCVYIPFMTNDYMPSQRDLKKCEDDASIQEFTVQEANLLSVAMTRAKRFVWLSYFGQPSQFIEKLQG